ncbi:MAG: vitamin K epoxide reductase family protein [Candidatus Dormiibacterota bacterium]
MVPATAGADSGTELRSPDERSESSPLGAVALVVLALVGIGLAGYLTAVHYAPTLLVCSNSGVINCEAVLTSSFSLIPGTSIPITVPGLAFFLVSLALAGSQLRRPENYQLRQAHAVWGGLGLLTALYLVFVEVMEVHNICLWCSCVHLTLLLTFLITLWRLYPKPNAR